MATVISSPREVNLFQVRGLAGQVLRAATPEDLERQAKIEGDVEPNEMRECQADIDAARLPMRLVEVEHVFGGEKVVFYFTADGRVDFRHLVREIAHKYRTRIEFRQVGVRDEARLLAEYEHCGQPLCCRSFLRGLEPVTMRMAKLQKATLDPTKISGRCGRLMCCLRYEEEAYAYLRTQLPARGVYVLTDELTGQVLSGDIISQRVTLDSGGRRVNIKVADIKQVSDTPLAAPAPRVPAEPVHVPPPRREQRAPRQNAPSGGGRPLPGRRPEPARQQQGSSIQPRAEDRAGGAGQPGQAGQLGQPGQPGRPDARPGGRPGRRRGRRRGGRHHGRGGAAAPPAGPAG
jgi:cell fate regulator YaaT (PSP1 superfamily)